MIAADSPGSGRKAEEHEGFEVELAGMGMPGGNSRHRLR